VQQHELGEHLTDDRNDAEAPDMRIGHDSEQACPVAMRRAEPVGEVGKTIEMQRTGDRDPY
jgi:hypothetical protein